MNADHTSKRGGKKRNPKKTLLRPDFPGRKAPARINSSPKSFIADHRNYVAKAQVIACLLIKAPYYQLQIEQLSSNPFISVLMRLTKSCAIPHFLFPP